MKNPKVKTIVVHSQTKSAWNVIGQRPGGKYKIARVPYLTSEDEKLERFWREEAFNHANFISYCFNRSNSILNKNN